MDGLLADATSTSSGNRGSGNQDREYLSPIELLEFTDPNHPGRGQQSKMLIQTPPLQSTP